MYTLTVVLNQKQTHFSFLLTVEYLMEHMFANTVWCEFDVVRVPYVCEYGVVRVRCSMWCEFQPQIQQASFIVRLVQSSKDAFQLLVAALVRADVHT